VEDSRGRNAPFLAKKVGGRRKGKFGETSASEPEENTVSTPSILKKVELHHSREGKKAKGYDRKGLISQEGQLSKRRRASIDIALLRYSD